MFKKSSLYLYNKVRTAYHQMNENIILMYGRLLMFNFYILIFRIFSIYVLFSFKCSIGKVTRTVDSNGTNSTSAGRSLLKIFIARV